MRQETKLRLSRLLFVAIAFNETSKLSTLNTNNYTHRRNIDSFICRRVNAARMVYDANHQFDSER